MERCQKVRRFFWWIRVPLTFGDVIADDIPRQGSGGDDDDGSPDKWSTTVTTTADQVVYNGKIASIQLLLLLIIISFTLIVWQVLTESYGVIKTVSLTFFMIVGLCVLVYFNVHRSRILLPQHSPTTDKSSRVLFSSQHTEDNNSSSIPAAVASTPRISDGPPPPQRDSLAVIGITTFYFLGCIMDIFQILLTLSCNDVWSTCRTTYYTTTNAVLVLYHVVRIAFLGAQTLFCIVFNRATFSDAAIVRWGLMCVAAINMSLWFDFLVGIVFHLLRFERRFDSLKFPCYDDPSNASAEAVACLMQNTTMHQFYDAYMTPIFLPFSIEIAVLIGECLYHLLCHCSTSPPVGKTARMDPSVKEGQQEAVGNRSVDCDTDSKEASLQTARGEIQVGDCDESSRLLSSGGGSGTLPAVNGTRLGWQLSFLLLFVTNAFLLTLAILYRINSATTAYLYYKFPVYLLMTLAIVTGYNASRGFRVQSPGLPFTAIDYLLVFSSFGQLSLDLLSFIAFLDWTHPRVFFAAQKLLEMMQTHLQVTFALYASRVQSGGHHRTAAGAHSSGAVVFRYVIFYLAVSNATLWLVESCNGLNLNVKEHGFYADSAETRYYTRLPWALMFNSLAPFLLVFRFLSCLAFARTFMRLPRLHAKQASQ